VRLVWRESVDDRGVERGRLHELHRHLGHRPEAINVLEATPYGHRSAAPRPRRHDAPRR
jgi:hypothetical protein